MSDMEKNNQTFEPEDPFGGTDFDVDMDRDQYADPCADQDQPQAMDQDEYQDQFQDEYQDQSQGEYQDQEQDQYPDQFSDQFQDDYEDQFQDQDEEQSQYANAYQGQSMRPGIGQDQRMRPDMSQMQGMRPGMGRGQGHPGMGQGMGQSMGQGMGQGMKKPQKQKEETPTVLKYIRTMFSRKIVIVGFAIFMIFVIMAVFAPVIARYDPTSMDYMNILAKPSAAHWLGTDDYGRDTFARLVYGARISLVIGVVAVFLAAVVGITLGMIAGYFGGVLDMVIQRVMEALNSIPNVMMSLALIAVLGNSIWDLGVVLSFVTIPSYVRMTRSMTYQQKNSDSVKAAQMAGASSMYVIFKHILPNIMSPNIIMIMSNVGTTILLESALSFLGVGISIPTPSWGTMVADGRAYLLSNPYVSIIPGLCVALLVISLNLLGDGIRDMMDPRLRGMH